MRHRSERPRRPAIVFVNGETRSFVADDRDIEGDIVTATGRWRQLTGPRHDPIAFLSPPVTRSWPGHRLNEIRWLDAEEAA